MPSRCWARPCSQPSAGELVYQPNAPIHVPLGGWETNSPSLCASSAMAMVQGLTLPLSASPLPSASERKDKHPQPSHTRSSLVWGNTASTASLAPYHLVLSQRLFLSRKASRAILRDITTTNHTLLHSPLPTPAFDGIAFPPRKPGIRGSCLVRGFIASFGVTSPSRPSSAGNIYEL